MSPEQQDRLKWRLFWIAVLGYLVLAIGLRYVGGWNQEILDRQGRELRWTVLETQRLQAELREKQTRKEILEELKLVRSEESAE